MPPYLLLLAGAVIGYYLQEVGPFVWVLLGGAAFDLFGVASEVARRSLATAPHRALEWQRDRAVERGRRIEGDF